VQQQKPTFLDPCGVAVRGGGELFELPEIPRAWSGVAQDERHDRRLRLGVGATKTLQAAWLTFPDLAIVKAAQKYTRIDEFTYRYASGTFEAELTVDDDGLVAAYAEWRRTGVAMGPNDTEPLDATR